MTAPSARGPAATGPAATGRVVAGLLGLAATLAAAAPADAGTPARAVLDADVVTTAIVAVRNALPEGWEVDDIQWNVTPAGWSGAPEAVKMQVIDARTRLVHPTGGFRYHPFWRIWFVPTGWEGRMAVTAYADEASDAGVLLGERDDFRVLIRTLGVTSWDEAPAVLTGALALEPFPLGHRPLRTLDVAAMQRLYQRLDAATGGRIGRWQQQVYGIAELQDTLYLELLTWERRIGPEAEDDPTWLGEIAERETSWLARQAIAAFPEKRALYLRRVTEGSFSDVILVNPRLLAQAP